jgi:glycosyltransferase involved in cell wall biosynthesis
MKIGIHLGIDVPESGGVFTFQRSIGEALLEIASQSQHSFVVFHGNQVNIAPTRNVTSVPLNLPKYVRAYYRFCRSIGYVANVLNCQPFLIPQNSGVARRIEQSGVDIVWYVGPFCYTMDMPYIITVLDLQHRLQPYFPEVSANGIWEDREQIYSIKLRRATKIIVSTEVGKKEIETFYQVPADRIQVLPYAAPKYNSSLLGIGNGENVLKKYNIPNNYLFYPGQFWPQKNHVGLLYALQILLNKWNISLPIVFTGSDKGNLDYVKTVAAELGVNNQLYFLGFVPIEDIAALYKNALALTMPTLVGPDNIPALEAFALSCPVITSDLPGFEEQLGDAALLVDPKDEEQIAFAIKSLYENKELRQNLIKKGLERVARWTWTDYVQGVFKILDKFEPIRRTWGKSV